MTDPEGTSAQPADEAPAVEGDPAGEGAEESVAGVGGPSR